MPDGDDGMEIAFRGVPFRVKRQIAEAIREQAEELAAELRGGAPEGETGNLKKSIRVRRGRNTLEVIVSAGGSLTTKQVGTRSYRRQINIGAGEETQNVPRGNQMVAYDYALAQEFGTQHQPASPWFFPTCRKREAEINAAIEDAVEEILRNA